MSPLDKMPYFDNFFLDGLVLLFGMAVFVFITGIVVYVAQILYALFRALLDKLRKKQ